MFYLFGWSFISYKFLKTDLLIKSKVFHGFYLWILIKLTSDDTNNRINNHGFQRLQSFRFRKTKKVATNEYKY
jgi:hypothetical protein